MTCETLKDIKNMFLNKGWSGAFRDAIFGGDGRDKKCEAYYEVGTTKEACYS